ncbi:MAG: 4Fe-4S binding protein [Phycisphaerales bacterium]|jgi:Na+-translocating ferredoxin:NAD+ oxidoreductase subunit B|nr:4Fe-4S binding protein [Phycisphaerales bacterium]MBT7170224.1 4Fe-4S binding protein [Phycisphaerales bacterium]
MDRRTFLKWTGRGAGVVALATVGVCAGNAAGAVRPRWQIDPDKCVRCGKCETACVRKPSAVKALNDLEMCANCFACHGHVHTSKNKRQNEYGKSVLDCDPENDPLICRLDAVDRTRINRSNRYTYTINHDLCVGCGDCVERCTAIGMGSMFLSILPTLCHGCNECAIARVCPEDAIVRVSSSEVLESRETTTEMFPEDCNACRTRDCRSCTEFVHRPHFGRKDLV